ncbi:hypothetical protein BKA56DRAFT_240897 [Ilyonectria sp. MPI-CAGE-AT-0026]|nr:hypothetical protein BKA56DRAFT_240897 [Ilyonectria sp. MPI-CAGE-AT-0026]
MLQPVDRFVCSRWGEADQDSHSLTRPATITRRSGVCITQHVHVMPARSRIDGDKVMTSWLTTTQDKSGGDMSSGGFAARAQSTANPDPMALEPESAGTVKLRFTVMNRDVSWFLWASCTAACRPLAKNNMFTHTSNLKVHICSCHKAEVSETH